MPIQLSLKHGAAAEIDVPNGTPGVIGQEGTASPGIFVNVAVGGRDMLTINTGAATQDAAPTIVVTGAIHSNLLLSGVLNFGSYDQEGGRLSTQGVMFAQAPVVLNCDVGPSANNNQIAGVSGSRIEVGGAVAKHTEFVMQGTGAVAGPQQRGLGGVGLLIVDKVNSYHGVAALDDAIEAFKNLNNITSFKQLAVNGGSGGPNIAIELFRGNSLINTVLFAEPSGHQLTVATGFGNAGTYIYDAGVTPAQIAGFGLTTLPTHA